MEARDTGPAPLEPLNAARAANGAAACPPSRWRPKQEQTTDNQERWLISYADFITLLMALFMTLYGASFSVIRTLH